MKKRNNKRKIAALKYFNIGTARWIASSNAWFISSRNIPNNSIVIQRIYYTSSPRIHKRTPRIQITTNFFFSNSHPRQFSEIRRKYRSKRSRKPRPATPTTNLFTQHPPQSNIPGIALTRISACQPIKIGTKTAHTHTYTPNRDAIAHNYYIKPPASARLRMQHHIAALARRVY